MQYYMEVVHSKLLESFLCNKLNSDDANIIKESGISNNQIGNLLVDLISNTSVSELFEIIRLSENKRVITTNNIPQFSNYNEIDNVISIIIDSGIIGMSYKTLGYYLAGRNKSEAARAKYGENHYKLVMQLGFATENKKHLINSFGIAYKNLSSNVNKDEILAKLALRIPIIQELLIQTDNGIVNASKVLQLYLSNATAIRRRSNIKTLLNKLAEYSDKEFITRINSIIWE